MVPASRRAFRLLLAAQLASCCALVGCDGEERRQAEGLAQVVERYRRADNRIKPQMVAAIEGTRCSSRDVCAARASCLGSAKTTSKALALKDEVARGLAELGSGKLSKESEAAQALPAKLTEAEALLKEGFQSLSVCDEQLLALKRTYRF